MGLLGRIRQWFSSTPKVVPYVCSTCKVTIGMCIHRSFCYVDCVGYDPCIHRVISASKPVRNGHAVLTYCQHGARAWKM
jgi:hypothetical protein